MREAAWPRELGAILRLAEMELSDAGIVTANLDARLLVQEATGHDHVSLLLRPDLEVPARSVARLRQWLDRRRAGEPVFRILGWREFYGLRLTLSQEVLEPRPDTETIVDHALPFLRAAADRRGTARILDLGTGSGAIALALLAQEARSVATGADLSADALATACRNAAMNGLAPRFTALQSDWFDQVSGSFDLILSNPPYIPSEEISGLAPEVRLHDPPAALDGGADGLAAYRKISRRALEFLDRDGHLLVEIGHGQQQDVTALFEANGLRFLSARRDLSGHVRTLALVPDPKDWKQLQKNGLAS